MNRGWIWTILVSLLAVVPAVITQQSRAALVAQRTAASARLERLNSMLTENAGLRHKIDTLAARAGEEQASARAALARVQSELAEEGRALAVATTAGSAEPFGGGSVVAAADWRNAGNTTAEAALETALWAGAGGDIGVLAGLLRLSADSRAAVNKALAELPADARAQYSDADRFMAALTAADIPLSAMRVSGWFHLDALGAQKMAIVEEYTGRDPKLVQLKFVHGPSGWKLAVPDEVVNNYLGRLKSGI